MAIIKIMNGFMKKNLAFVILSLFMGLFTILCNVGLLSTSSVLISWAALKPDVLDLMVLIVGVRFFGIFRGAFRYAERILSHEATLRILSRLRAWFYKSFNEGYCENNKTYKTGDIYTKLVNDVDVLKEFFLRGVYPLIISIATGIVVTIFLTYFNITLAIIFLSTFILCGFILPYIYLKLSINIVKEEMLLREEQNNFLLDCFNGSLEISLYNKVNVYEEKFKEYSKQVIKLQLKKNLINTFGENTNTFIVVILMAIALILNGNKLALGELNSIFYAMIPLTIMASFEALVQSNNSYYKIYESIKAGENILKIIDISGEINEEKSIKVEGFDIKVKDLTVEEDGIEILKNISFNLPQGKKLAIVGATGSGKTTILRTLLGFTKISSGEITLDSKSYNKISKDRIRELYTYVDQNPYIFNATVEENLKIANLNVHEEEVNNVIERVNLKELIDELPEKEETVLWQYGASISGGEKERLAVARALLKGGEIALLDEPTASMDLELEKTLMKVIKDEYKNKSLILVTHRLIAMEDMDEIIVLDKGQVVQRGTHNELSVKNGLYREMISVTKEN